MRMGNTSSAHGFIPLNLVLIDCANFENIRFLHHCFILQLNCPSIVEMQTWTQLSLLLVIEVVNQRTLNEYANKLFKYFNVQFIRTAKVSALALIMSSVALTARWCIPVTDSWFCKL